MSSIGVELGPLSERKVRFGMKTRLQSFGRFLMVVSIGYVLPTVVQAQSPEGPFVPCAPFAGADPKMPPGGPMPGRPVRGMLPPQGFPDSPLPPFLRGINLTEEQLDKIFSIQHAQAPLLREKAKAAHKTHEELLVMVTSERYDEPTAKGLAETSARALADLGLLRATTDRQIYALLTAEQRAQVNKLLSAQRERRARIPPGSAPFR